MCELNIKTGGYKLETTGRFATPDNIEELEDKEIKELLEKGASAYEVLMLRKSNHIVVGALNNMTANLQKKITDSEKQSSIVLEMLQKMEENFYINLPVDKHIEPTNGSTKRKINDVVLELSKFHESERRKKATINLISSQKYTLIIILGLILGISIKFHTIIDSFFMKLEGTILFATSSAIFLATLGFLLKFFFKRKFGDDDK
jgi:hypothetical protein